MLTQENVPVGINTVVQESNLHELSQLGQILKDISPDIIHACIPIAVDISEEKSFIYTEEYQTILWPYVSEFPSRKKVILSNGKYLIQNCHAGKRDIVIGPDGKIYTCVTGAYFREREQRDTFLLGDLRQSTLDEILVNEEKRESVYAHAVKTCSGCSNSCEVNREILYFDGGARIAPQEIPAALRLEKERMIGNGVLDYVGWHTVEETADGSRWCWSSSTVAKVFVPLKSGENGNKWKRGGNFAVIR